MTRTSSMTLERAEEFYDAAREDVGLKMRTMVEAHDRWYLASRSDQLHPVTAKVTAERWARFQAASDEWQTAMATLRVARRRVERLRG